MNKTVSHCLAFSRLLLPVIGEITPRKKKRKSLPEHPDKTKSDKPWNTFGNIFVPRQIKRKKNRKNCLPFFPTPVETANVLI